MDNVNLLIGIIGGIVGMLGGRALDYFYYQKRLEYDYKMEIQRRRLNAYENFCRKSFFALPGNLFDVKELTKLKSYLEDILPYCSQEILDKAQTLLEKSVLYKLSIEHPSPESPRNFQEYKDLNAEIISLIRKEISDPKIESLGPLKLNVPDQRI